MSEEVGRRLVQLRLAVDLGLIPRTWARIELGSASWQERWAWRFPRLLARLCPQAAADRIRWDASPGDDY